MAVSLTIPLAALTTEASANLGFPEFTEAALDSLIVYLGLDIGAKSTEFLKLEALLKHALPAASEKDILSIMHMRGQHDHIVDSSFWENEEVLQTFNESDKAHINKYVDSIVKEPKKKEFSEELWSRTQKAWTTTSTASTTTTGKKKRKVDPSRNRPGREQMLVEAKCIPLEMARQWTPPGTVLSKDAPNSRWLIKYPPFGSLSRSWALYGETTSLKCCLAWSWHVHQKATGEEIPWPWMVEIDWKSPG